MYAGKYDLICGRLRDRVAASFALYSNKIPLDQMILSSCELPVPMDESTEARIALIFPNFANRSLTASNSVLAPYLAVDSLSIRNFIANAIMIEYTMYVQQRKRRTSDEDSAAELLARTVAKKSDSLDAKSRDKKTNGKYTRQSLGIHPGV